jgi:hypothetical protein
VGTQTVNYTGPLPVELQAFEAAASNGDAFLKWSTASEKNNARFVIERSATGQEFSAVGEVAGSGSSAQVRAYSFRDAGAVRFGSALYYRLRQEDHDGSTSYSPVRQVRFNREGQGSQVLLYPNPSSANVTCNLALLPTGSYRVTVVSVTGKVLSTTTVTTGQAQELDLSALAAGVYLVRVQGGTLNLTQRLVKLQ